MTAIKYKAEQEASLHLFISLSLPFIFLTREVERGVENVGNTPPDPPPFLSTTFLSHFDADWFTCLQTDTPN